MSKLKDGSRLETMVQQQVIERGIHDERVIAALRSVPRDRFFPPGSKDEAFADRAAPIGHGQSISQPYIVALMTHLLDIHSTDTILELGTGSGYQTAILARLAHEIFTIERIKPLLDDAWEKLMEMGVRNVHFRHGDGTAGWPEAAPFDRILIGAGAPTVPVRLLRDQLKDGGIAVLPVGPHDQQMLVQIRKHGDRLVSKNICPCRFVKLIGELGWDDEKPGMGR
jgi:protein-L-isoaspartate(D-aspartate) O-methyltransferase